MTSTLPRPKRRVICTDALEWLAIGEPLVGAAVVTSLPDVCEFNGLSLECWQRWFVRAAAAIFAALPPDSPAIFYQTDIKVDGVWIDKAYLCQRAAEAAGVSLLWHKIVCRKAPGVTTYGRPAYAHLLAFSRGLRDDPARSVADVLADGGWMAWRRAIGVDAARLACRYVKRLTPLRRIVDPFCGQGTILAVANELGLEAIGVDLSAKRCRLAAALRLPEKPTREEI
ncbi:MAG TPA: SAM-dependent methyltransferase [Nannocystis exedens]|nr:SAM-dependent methyltransferase [Nannocystis exedens]